MRYAYAFIVNHPRMTLAMLSFLILVVLWTAFADLVPSQYERHLRWPLFLTTLAWAPVASLVGMVHPISPKAMKYSLIILGLVTIAIFVISMEILIGAASFTQTIPDQLLWVFPLWAGMVVLIAATWPANFCSKGYLILVVAPLCFIAWITAFFSIPGSSGLGYTVPLSLLVLLLSVGSVVWQIVRSFLWRRLLRIVLVVPSSLGLTTIIVIVTTAIVRGTVPIGLSEPPGAGVFATIAALSLLFSVLSTLSGLVLIGMMRPFARKATVTVIAMWVVMFTMGWFWYLAMDDGLDTFTGEERRVAETALERTTCVGSVWLSPIKKRMINDTTHGQFQVLCHTWWGLPAHLIKGRTE